jgi:hypothetical protein
MYARSTDIRGKPENVDAGIAYVQDTVLPAVLQMEGCVGLSMLADRDSGRCIATTAWADAEAMRMSAEKVRDIRNQAADNLGGDYQVREWEIAVLHRLHESPDGACCRVIWSTGDPSETDRMIDAFRMGVIPRLEELPGFCAVSALVDRGSGLSATAVVYAGREAMAQDTEQAVGLRQEFMQQVNRQVTEVAEFDLAVAHLRVPETV